MPGLLRGAMRTAVVAGTATSVSGRVRRRQEQRWGQEDGFGQAPAAPAPPSSALQGGNANRIEELKQLAGLKEQGILTAAEFEAEKARILGG